MPLTPNNREEHWLQGMVDGQTTLEPNKRREYWYKEIVDAIGSGGGGGTGVGVLVATATQSGAYVTLDKTWKELADAMESGIVPVVLYIDGTNKYKETVTMINETSDSYRVSTTSDTFEVDTETGYPSYYED